MGDAFRAAFEGVISLPSSVVSSSDSGQRDRGLSSSSGARRKSGSNEDEVNANTGPRPGTPTLGLAATALDDSDAARKQALGRSEAGVSVVEDGDRKQRSSPLLFIGGAIALTIAVGGVIVWSARTAPGTTTSTVGTMAPPSAAASPPPSANVTPPPPPSAASVTASADAGAPAAASITASSKATTAQVPPVRPTAHGNGVASGVAPRPSADTPPRPTAKPSSEPPDLY
jgi:hypothetical protein